MKELDLTALLEAIRTSKRIYLSPTQKEIEKRLSQIRKTNQHIIFHIPDDQNPTPTTKDVKE